MQKANWQNDGDHVRLSMPISKVDVEQRRVSGWASLDNIDQHSDLVDAAASREAFANFRGNVREQHDQLKPVGKLVDIKEDVYYSPQDDRWYQGIYVTAYVSKGAPDTWEKVLDGTLSGFSIGGNVIEAENEIDPETKRPYRRVKKYMLDELSLVDNPANQYANVVSLQKLADSQEIVLTGDLADITIENVFVCKECLDDGLGVHKSGEEALECPICGTAMFSIGFIESSDPEPKATIKKMLETHLAADREGGVTETMSDVTTTTTEVTEVTEVQPAAEVETAEVTAEETVEVEEVSDPLAEAVASLRELTDRIEEGRQAQAGELADLKKSLSDLDGRFEERLNTFAEQVKAIEGQQSEFAKKFEGLDASVEEVRKGLSTVDASTAIKKSADSDQPAEEEKTTKGFWSGSFLNIESL